MFLREMLQDVLKGNFIVIGPAMWVFLGVLGARVIVLRLPAEPPRAVDSTLPLRSLADDVPADACPMAGHDEVQPPGLPECSWFEELCLLVSSTPTARHSSGAPGGARTIGTFSSEPKTVEPLRRYRRRRGICAAADSAAGPNGSPQAGILTKDPGAI